MDQSASGYGHPQQRAQRGASPQQMDRYPDGVDAQQRPQGAQQAAYQILPQGVLGQGARRHAQ